MERIREEVSRDVRLADRLSQKGEIAKKAILYACVQGWLFSDFELVRSNNPK